MRSAVLAAVIGGWALVVDGLTPGSIATRGASQARAVPHARRHGLGRSVRRLRGERAGAGAGAGSGAGGGIRMMASNDPQPPPRVLIVANRLPVVAYRDGGEVGEKMMSSFYSKLQGQQKKQRSFGTEGLEQGQQP